MPDLDEELLERVARWCAEAGRAAATSEIRRALGALSWDELLAVRALLADPPPAAPLGPFALADLARGVPADSAADREREGRYPQPDDAGGPPPMPAPPPPAPARAARRGGKRASVGPVIRRARDAAPPQPPPAPAVPLVDELFLPEGRAILDRLVRRHGAVRHALVAALAQGWLGVDGRPADDEVLSRLLDHHGLARAFDRREHDELLHALRASGGLRTAAAARLGLDRPAFDAALTRAGAGDEAERIREARRAEIRAKATLAERVRLLLTEPARLEDLGILAELEDDLRRRLPEHLRAVGAAGGPLLIALARSLSISPPEAQALADRLGVVLDRERSAGPGGRAPPRARQRVFTSGGATGGLRTPRRRTGGGPGDARRGPPAAPGEYAPPRGRRDPGLSGREPPRRQDRGEPRFGAPRERRGQDRGEPRFGAPRERRGQGEGGFASRPRPGAKGPGIAPARARRARPAASGSGPRERRGGAAGTPGGPRQPGGAGSRRPGGASRPGGARPGRPGPRPGGGRERPPRKGPRR